METKTYKLDSLCEITSSKRIFYSEYTESGIPFFRSKEIIDLFNKNNISTELFISESRYNEIKNKFGVPEKDDMLLTSVGSIGIPYLVKSSDKFYFKDGNLTWFRNYNRKLIVPLYLYLWTTSSVGKETLMRLSMGAAQPALTISRLKNLSLNLPSVSVQQKIASILSSYDRLIKNNTRRIRLLEQMAENLYKEWFVRFRFPEHENVEMVNGLPKGWERKELFDIADITYGYAFKSNKFCSDNSLNAVVRIRDIQNNSTETYTDESCDERYLIVRNALLIGMDGIFHMCLWNGERAYLNQRVVMLNSKYNDMCNYLLYFAIRPQIKYWEQVIVGTTVAHLGDKHRKKIKVLIPDTNTLRVANKLIESAMKEINDLQQQIQLLTRQRDLLLPRLMSGKLEVKS